MYITKDRKIFYFSGCLAILIYLICFSLLIIYLNAPKVEKYDSLNKNTVLELELIILKDNKSIKENKTKEEIVKKSASKNARQKNEVKSLFSKVKVNSKNVLNVLNEDVKNIQNTKLSSRYKSNFEKEKRTSSPSSVSKILSKIKTKASIIATNSDNNKDKYFSKIHEILSSRWQPASKEEGFAKVIIKISKNGDFSYRFLSYSGNERFDEYLRTFLESQVKEKYPVHESGTAKEIDMKFGLEG